jgi:thiol-disulfide isomerase/thioredoxin
MMRLFGAAFALALLASPAWAESFSVKDMSGKTQALGDYKGKWVLVNYWATWCPPCLEEIPDLIALHDKHKNKDLAVIGIAVDYKNRKEIADFTNDMLMSYPIVLGDDKVMQQFGAADVLPTTFMYNPQGKLVKVHHGLITRQLVEKQIGGK